MRDNVKHPSEAASGDCRKKIRDPRVDKTDLLDCILDPGLHPLFFQICPFFQPPLLGILFNFSRQAGINVLEGIELVADTGLSRPLSSGGEVLKELQLGLHFVDRPVLQLVPHGLFDAFGEARNILSVPSEFRKRLTGNVIAVQESPVSHEAFQLVKVRSVISCPVLLFRELPQGGDPLLDFVEDLLRFLGADLLIKLFPLQVCGFLRIALYLFKRVLPFPILDPSVAFRESGLVLLRLPAKDSRIAPFSGWIHLPVYHLPNLALGNSPEDRNGDAL
ncbi:MAG: hypothetical protein PUG38_05420 [Sutterellaceae bacterium]|nr:hypothetical protein [Sutterellaceae bacterium]MDY2867887.1 hypothetical protein [Mesosutterella sp.]